MPITYLALGTNLGERRANLQRAVAALPPEVRPLSQSPVYETPAWGYEDQAPFLNMVLKAETELEPQALLAHLKRLEAGLGRTPSFRWGPRLIDIDILLYDALVLDTPDLTIPHARLHERAFVLVPLADLAPDLVHPVLGQSIEQLLAAVDKAGITRWQEPS
jgi:2-amino-4-hydroxy-6-hydroxymethyldihydropteridine diphosphokinase